MNLVIAQEIHYPDGTVMVDGKKMKVSDLETYREGVSTRTRARTRGGAKVRTKASWLQFCSWKHGSIYSLLDMCACGELNPCVCFLQPSMDERVPRRPSQNSRRPNPRLLGFAEWIAALNNP